MPFAPKETGTATTKPRKAYNAKTPSFPRQRVVNQLLTEMDGMESRKQVFVIAATNRPG